MTNKITITPEIKAEILKQYYDTDVEVKALAAKHGISRQTIYNWTKGMRRKSKPISIRITQSNKALWAARNHSAFEARVNSILRNANVSPNACLRDKLEEMARLHAEDKTAYPVKSLCAAMQVSRGAFYGYTRYGKHGHAWFDIHIAEIEKAVETVFNEMEQRFGAEKLTAKLKERGYHTCRATVKKIMKRLGLRSIRDGAKRQWRLEHRNPKDHVHRQFNPKSPNAVWGQRCDGVGVQAHEVLHLRHHRPVFPPRCRPQDWTAQQHPSSKANLHGGLEKPQPLARPRLPQRPWAKLQVVRPRQATAGTRSLRIFFSPAHSIRQLRERGILQEPQDRRTLSAPLQFGKGFQGRRVAICEVLQRRTTASGNSTTHTGQNGGTLPQKAEN